MAKTARTWVCDDDQREHLAGLTLKSTVDNVRTSAFKRGRSYSTAYSYSAPLLDAKKKGRTQPLGRHAALTYTARSHSAKVLELAGQRYAAGEDDLVTLLQAQSDYAAPAGAVPSAPGSTSTRSAPNQLRATLEARRIRLRGIAQPPDHPARGRTALPRLDGLFRQLTLPWPCAKIPGSALWGASCPRQGRSLPPNGSGHDRPYFLPA